MSTVVAALLGSGIGLGVLLVVAGMTGRAVLESADGQRTRRLRSFANSAHARDVAVAAGIALVVVLLTGWPVGGVLAGGAALAAPRLLGGRAARESAVARTEAIASWTELIRDSIAAASGLEEAIMATAPIAPAAIRREVSLLVTRLRHSSLPDALAAFGDDVRHPSADLVVAALTIAARMEASDLSGLLSRLAESIRGEARMRIRVEVGRARVRTAAKIIVGVVIATVVLLAGLNREYLEPYGSALGQVVLLVVAAIFATGGWLLVRMAGIELPERFSARPREAAQ
ncbi:MAG: type II secretion system F family protein [Acidimicrobiia bacterium]